jgi:hypothetical protein
MVTQIPTMEYQRREDLKRRATNDTVSVVRASIGNLDSFDLNNVSFIIIMATPLRTHFGGPKGETSHTLGYVWRPMLVGRKQG